VNEQQSQYGATLDQLGNSQGVLQGIQSSFRANGGIGIDKNTKAEEKNSSMELHYGITLMRLRTLMQRSFPPFDTSQETALTL
jgi:hypothetical protein